VTFPELERMLVDRLARDANLPVFITGHKQTKHGAMIYVLDFVRRAGAGKVAFAVKARE
jgi:biopolymer transport protein ExbD